MMSNRFDECFYKTTHNSYKNSIVDQLNDGVRGFELDIHDGKELTYFLKRMFGLKSYFKIGHWYQGHEVHHGDGNPRFSNNLENWLKVFVKWSDNNQGHGPITIFFDIKDNLIDNDNIPSEKYGLIRLNEQIVNAFGKRKLFTVKDFLSFNKNNSPQDYGWPNIDELENKFIIVLMSFYASSMDFFKKGRIFSLFKKIINVSEILDTMAIPAMKTRLTYLEDSLIKNTTNPVCFVALNPDDKDKKGYLPILNDKTVFVTSYEHTGFYELRNQKKIIRTDYVGISDWLQFVSFPAIDNWREEGYLTSVNNVIV